MQSTKATFHRWDDMPKERVSDLLQRRLITGERMMLAHVYLDKGCIVPRHSHDNEQLTYILEGALHFWLGEDGEEEVTVRAGEVLVIPPNLPHKAEALEDTLDVDIFSPPRQDWLSKSDAYLRNAEAMDLGLKGKVALVAAASRGLGRAVAEELAEEGASLILCARGESLLDDVRESLSAKVDGRVVTVAADVSVTADVERVVARGLERFGRIDILVTNGGGPPAGQFDHLGREAWDAATRLVLNSVIDFTRLVLPGMKERGWGRILNVTSIAVKQPVDNLMLSNSLRAAVTGFARTLANEVAAQHITVNNILPGYTRTERVEQLADAIAAKEGVTPSAVKARWEADIPMRRLGEPREFAALAAFLVSERASYITGSSIAVDGGWIRSLL